MHYNIIFNIITFYYIFECKEYVYVRGEWEQSMYSIFKRQKPGKML